MVEESLEIWLQIFFFPKAYTPTSILSTQQIRSSINKLVGRDRENSRILKKADSDIDPWAMQCQLMAKNH